MWLFKREAIRKFFHFFSPDAGRVEVEELPGLRSAWLKREVRVRVLLPPGYAESSRSYPLLVLNDGQDLEALRFVRVLERLYRKGKVGHFIAVAVHAGDRMQEYGTTGRADYMNRGLKAGVYTRFLLRELLPLLRQQYRIDTDPQAHAIAGFSLGGLSAFDVGWHHPEVFGQIGVFSGSLWWRSKPFREEAPDADRIVQTYVETSKTCPPLRFWLQAGTDDEQADRNNNGIIDAIDDTLDLIKALEGLGYDRKQAIRYVEVSGGEHNPQTWGQVMPDFLQWAFPKRATNE
ncbi:MAG: alpha/beta hydrolase [Phaeodactylibacter xiamenensis]|uniref:alpha/beta hydrolase n=1 Tax=Phaeodactylibacter xiamenensis TaxID=1524460 RepID=UPI0009DF6987|nr:alpha/beta hydrolase-fold protein [Phaeodactylibacter xiamenensis]MCR9050320.1 alpha/beta hydrolase-fold protein [bacterium]